MKKSNRLRWIPFSQMLPPIGMLVEIKSFKSWSAKDAYRGRIYSVGDPQDSIIGISCLKHSRSKGSRKFVISSGSEYREDASWRYANGKKPSAGTLRKAKLRIERLQKKEATREKRQKARDLIAARARIAKEIKEQVRLYQLPLSGIPRLESHGHKVHYKCFPADLELKVDPHKKPTPACGHREGDCMTLDARLVTCANCRRIV